MESGGRGVERYQGFCSLFCCYYLMAVIHRSKMHCFSNIPNLAAHLVTLFPNFTWDHRYGAHSFFPFPSHPRLFTTYSTRYIPAPNVLYLALLLHAINILEREEAVEVQYGDDTLDSGVCDERGGEVECWGL